MAQQHTQDTSEAAYERFLDACPAYRSTAVLDEVRAFDFARLDEQRLVASSTRVVSRMASV